ncbi:hypothetical protein BZL30_1102 [Mycobacterium kansasii]|uniref:DUF732 domain-containing protein n=1 Tax=Mycobacterium kansasii TaxID=1768 RepID=A0A1V3XT01_MYCKA|nr:hypothetical protein BZL30_1102 [Mycobacterium kansasii]
MALMPEPVPASEETAALGGETAALPDSAPTNAVHTAWSHSDQPDQPDESDQPDASQDVRDDDRTSAIEAAVQTWGTTWGRAAALLLLGIGIAVLIVVGGWALTTEKSPARVRSHPRLRRRRRPPHGDHRAGSHDHRLDPGAGQRIHSVTQRPRHHLRQSRRRRLQRQVGLPELSPGMTVDQIVAAFRASNPALSSNAEDYVAISMRTYCP